MCLHEYYCWLAQESDQGRGGQGYTNIGLNCNGILYWSELSSRLHLSRWGDLISATTMNLDQKKTVGAEAGDCTVHSILKWIGGDWEKVWGALFPLCFK